MAAIRVPSIGAANDYGVNYHNDENKAPPWTATSQIINKPKGIT
jgi:hypothetical protein